jgi:hypothetical protein
MLNMVAPTQGAIRFRGTDLGTIQSRHDGRDRGQCRPGASPGRPVLAEVRRRFPHELSGGQL